MWIAGEYLFEVLGVLRAALLGAFSHLDPLLLLEGEVLSL